MAVQPIKRKSLNQKPVEPEHRDKLKREVFAILYFLLAALLLLSLFTEILELPWMGAVGHTVGFGIFYVFGRVSSFVLAGLLILWGVGQFRECPESTESRRLLRFLGALLMLISLCTLLALPFDPKVNKILHFQFGGLIGAYITYEIGIAQWLGPVGSYLVTGAAFLVGFVLTTEFLISVFFSDIKCRLKERRELKAAAAIATPEPKKTREKKEAAPVVVPVEDDPPFDADDEEVDLEDIALPSELDQGPRIILEDEKRQVLRTPVRPPNVDIENGEYILPPLDLLKEPPAGEAERSSRDDLEKESRKLEETLASFNIEARVMEVNQGPTVTRYELQLAPGVKLSSISSLQNDIALSMRASHVRIAPIPGKSAVGIEVPNRSPSPVFLREILDTDAFLKVKSKLAFGVGKTISGEPHVADLTRMPHLLIAGTTGSGKSVCLNGIIASILFRAMPDEVKFIMIDPKKVELSIFAEIPHLMTPIVTEAKKAAAALKWAVLEMERRYSLFADLSVRDIDSYYDLINQIKKEGRDPMDNPAGIPLQQMPLLVVVIDELADLMMVARADVEDMICRLAQMARAVGIHLVIATQRPSVDVITGLIKANFPSRIAFQVSSRIDSRTILDSMGAEALIGRGDMLFAPGGLPKPVRLQGAYVSNTEIQGICDFIRAQRPAQYVVPTIESIDNGNDGGMAGSEDRDVLYDEACKIVRKTQQASASLLQTHLGIGYPRARKIIEQMERDGLVGPMRGSKPREILIAEPDDME